MGQFGRLGSRRTLVLGAASFGLLTFMCAGSMNASEVEVRQFKIKVDKKEAGTYRMTLTREEDGTVAVDAEAHVKLNFVVVSYHYDLKSRELWRDGRLFTLSSTADDDGTKYRVNASAHGHSIEVQSNKDQTRLPAKVWTTTYWQLPPPERRDGDIDLLDADTGKHIKATITQLKPENVMFNKAWHTCSVYRVKDGGKVDVKLWYDAHERMFRQESKEGSHTSTLELTVITPGR